MHTFQLPLPTRVKRALLSRSSTREGGLAFEKEWRRGASSPNLQGLSCGRQSWILHKWVSPCKVQRACISGLS